MDYIKKIWAYAKPYKKYAYGNVIANVFYALFGSLAFVSLIPMLKVLFDDKKVVSAPPEYTSILELKDISIFTLPSR